MMVSYIIKKNLGKYAFFPFQAGKQTPYSYSFFPRAVLSRKSYPYPAFRMSNSSLPNIPSFLRVRRLSPPCVFLFSHIKSPFYNFLFVVVFFSAIVFSLYFL